MNPFRKRSTAVVSTTPVVEVPSDIWEDIMAPVPIASPEAVEDNPWADVPSSSSPPHPSVVLSPAKPSPTTTLPPSVAAPSTSSPPPKPKVTPRSPPPPIAPRRRSQIYRKAPAPEPEPVAPPIDDPFNTDTSEPESPPLNPFNRSSSETPEPVPTKQRQSLDVDAFKRLMLTGYADTPPAAAATRDGSSASDSGASRQSILESMLESKGGETPRTSEEVDVEGRRRPPPPKPRRVSPPLGRSASIRLSVPPPPPPPAPALTSPAASPIAKTPSSPPQATPPASPATSLKKRLAPSPPVSRRQSVRSSVELERPTTPSGGGGGKQKPPPPPPPPVRRMKSTNHRTHERSTSIGTMPPPPPPPPSRGRTVSGSTIEEKVPEEKDILIDLQKLQREVDELRGKYEQGIVTVE